MRNPLKFTAGVSVLLCLSAMAKDPVIYGEDNRRELFEAPTQYRELSKSVAILVHKSNIRPHPSASDRLQLNQTSFSEWLRLMTSPEAYEEDSDNEIYYSPKRQASLILSDYDGQKFCSEERFTEQPVAGECTGFLIGPDLLVTAGHCSQMEDFCQDFKWVFDYQVDRRSKKAGESISAEAIYSCKKVVASELNILVGLDHALVQLDRKVTYRKPLEFEVGNEIKKGDPLAVLGSPSGLPMKFADGGKVRNADHPFYFLASLDTFQGNSGSPVFHDRTGALLGFLVRGENDFVIDPLRKCRMSKRCEEEACQGEGISKLESVPELSLMQSLHQASASGDEATLDQILELGIWVDIYGARGVTPLMRAAKGQLQGPMLKLLNHGADPLLSDDKGETVLHYLAVNLTDKNQDLLSMLVAAGASLEARNDRGETALLVAARWFNLEGVRLLAAAGADKNVQNGHGKSVWDIFQRLGDEEALEALRELGFGPEPLN